MDLRKKIKEIILSAIACFSEEGFDMSSEIQIMKPKNSNHGDYALSIAMVIAKKKNQDPLIVAEKIKKEIEKQKDANIFSSIDVVAPGFINLTIGKDCLLKELLEVISKKEKFGCSNIGEGKKIQVEFVSANPTGPLTVGNGRGGPFGDVLANILIKAGYDIEKAYYVNDYGNQILSLGHSVLKDSEAKYSGEYIDKLNQEIANKEDVYQVGKDAAKTILEEYIKKTINNLNINYDDWFSETIIHESKLVDEVIDYYIENGYTYEQEGAVWLKTSEHGDERDRVIVKSDGNKTYLAGDLAYHKHKFIEKNFDKVINVWGSDHFGDVPGIKAGVEMLGIDRDRLEIILLQFVTVMKDGKPVKISKRLGTVITMDDLLDELSSDVIRFFFLQKSANTHLNFDMNLAKEQSDKNPVFYVQYAYARICSILKNASYNDEISITPELLDSDKEMDLIRKIIRLEEVLIDTAQDYQVHRLPQYALELASSFHQFYNDCHCLVDDEQLRNSRLAILLGAKIALNNILDVMGISSPEKM